jgi:membrane protease YdiL (CAAX protease family)
MVGMIVLSALFILFAKGQKIELSIFPHNFNKWYVITTSVVIVLLIETPSNYLDGVKAIVLLIYGSIVTPVFEELIFRGYVWNKLENAFHNKWIVYIFSVVLFGLWHIGYIDSIAFRTESGLLNAMIWKVIVGLCYGAILGGLRLKTKNCYSTILLHGVMNIFGR